MEERTKELIAIGASAAVNCHSCIDYHLAQCDRLGIDRDEVKAAAETGMMVGRGAATKTRTHLANGLGLAEPAEPAKGASSGCGCG